MRFKMRSLTVGLGVVALMFGVVPNSNAAPDYTGLYQIKGPFTNLDFCAMSLRWNDTPGDDPNDVQAWCEIHDDGKAWMHVKGPDA